MGSGYTEAPSSRGASETLSACSPSVAGLEDFLGDVSDDDLSWLEADLPAVQGLEEGRDQLSSDDSETFGDKAADVLSFEQHQPPRYTAPLELRVEDFECGECVGKGSYSRVFLGTHVVSGTEWALKVVSKRKTFETRENLAHLREEKNISSKVQGSDFLVRTAGTFQNPRRYGRKNYVIALCKSGVVSVAVGSLAPLRVWSVSFCRELSHDVSLPKQGL